MTAFFAQPTTPTVKIDDNGLIEFSQNSLFPQLSSGKLKNIKIQYNGLCEIICNYILMEDLLGEKHPLPLNNDVHAVWIKTQTMLDQLGIKFKPNTNFMLNYTDKYGAKITLDNLRKVEDTHILDVTNFFTRLIALLFSIYPCNLFSNSPLSKPPQDKIILPNGKTQIVVDKTMLADKLDKLDIGFYIKFFAFQKNGFDLKGHSMLIKKINPDQYSFFDPDHGEYTHLNIDELVNRINNAAEESSANTLLFVDAKEFVNSFNIAQKNIAPEEDNSQSINLV